MRCRAPVRYRIKIPCADNIKNGAFFDKKGTSFLLTERIVYAIIFTVEKYGWNFPSVSAANGSCRNKCRPISRFCLT